MNGKILSKDSEWTFELINQYHDEIARIAENYGLQTYPNQIEIISAEQMMDAYSSSGMPLGYSHWSFGKQFVGIEKKYKRGYMGLAYELVINSNPCIAYLIEENSMTMQALVIAHACYGHNSFFKNNYLFKSWTNADAIVDYLLFAKNYITSCEEKYGIDVVEETLDSCHALMSHGIDRYKHPAKLSLQKEQLRHKNREEYLQSQVNDLWRTIPKREKNEKTAKEFSFPEEPQENILYFLEKNAPLLESWQKEIVRIVRKIAQYFYPQRQTKVMNEGWATFWHYTILNTLYDEGFVSDEFMMEFLKTHTDVIYQPPFDSRFYNGLNPYTLGFGLFKDIRRICENPTEEDKKWFPDIANTDWKKTLDFAMRNYKDESFIGQFLSPQLMRELKLFSVLDDDQKEHLEISAIHDELGYQHLRRVISGQYNLSNNEPNIQIHKVDIRGDRSLTLRHIQYNHIPLEPASTQEVLKHLYRLWGFTIRLESVEPENHRILALYQCPE